MRFVLIGHPVAHSLSPAIHRAAYEALGEAHSYELIDAVDDEAVRQQLEALRRGELAGANVTVPHKVLALGLADHLDRSAADVGAANVLAREGSSIKAYNTDALGLSDEIVRLLPAGRRTPSGGSAVVIGTGGAARAAVVAAKLAGLDQVSVTGRRWTSSTPEPAWPEIAAFRGLGALPVTWPDDPAGAADWQRAVLAADLIIQASSAGMRGADSGERVADLVPWSVLKPGARAYDLVYNPAVTPFLSAASRARVTAVGGLGMLVGQAARAIEIWLGRRPPAAPLLVAAQAALAGRE